MIKLYFCDLYPGFNQERNFFTSCFRCLFGTVKISSDPDEADLIIASIFGDSHKDVITNYRPKTILWLGENIRPNIYNPRYSLTCDFYDYSSTNTRLPLWFLEIDWFNDGAGLFSLESIYNTCVRPGTFSSSCVSSKEFCITIFNNTEGMRMSALSTLMTLRPVSRYGKPFGNWFPTTASYGEKLKRMSNYAFNLCPENSFSPGYYTEKALHSKMAHCVPIYMADPYFKNDFRPQALLNLYDYHSSSKLAEDVEYYFSNKSALAELLNQPLFSSMPSVKSFLYSLYRTSINILSR